MESTRQQKISRLIQKDLGEIFRLFARNNFPGFLITVTKVYITPDLSQAKVYLSLFGQGSREGVFGNINQHKKEIRHQLALRVGKQMRVFPELLFFIDDSLDYIENIDNLLKT